MGGHPTGRDIFEDGQVHRGGGDVLGPDREAVHGRVRKRRNGMRGNYGGGRYQSQCFPDRNQGGRECAQGAQDFGLGVVQRTH